MALNLYADDWDEENSEPGFRWKRAFVGRRLGGELLGASLYELPPGERTWPYHFEYGNEEWLLVVAGTPTLRTPDEEQELRPGDVVCFRRGPDGAHVVENRSGSPARVLVLSTMISPTISEYPDSGKVGVWRGGSRAGIVFREASRIDYWEGESP